MNRILLIDDDPGLTRALSRRLEAEGYVVRTARSGLSGWKIAERGKHDLILLDAAAPGLNGYELLDRLRKNGDATPVILLASQDSEADRIRGLRLGADDTSNIRRCSNHRRIRPGGWKRISLPTSTSGWPLPSGVSRTVTNSIPACR